MKLTAKGTKTSINHTESMYESHSEKTLRMRQNDHQKADAIFKLIFLNQNCCCLIQISPKFILKDCIDNKSAMFQIMAWCRTGTKPLSEPMMAKFTEETMNRLVLMRWLVMACCRPLTRHCLNQGWPRSMSPYGISMPHWVYLLLTVIIPTVSVRRSSAIKYTIPVCVLWYIGAERKWRPFCGRYFKFLSKNEICCFLMRISLKFVPRSPIANRSVLV